MCASVSEHNPSFPQILQKYEKDRLASLKTDIRFGSFATAQTGDHDRRVGGLDSLKREGAGNASRAIKRPSAKRRLFVRSAIKSRPIYVHVKDNWIRIHIQSVQVQCEELTWHWISYIVSLCRHFQICCLKKDLIHAYNINSTIPRTCIGRPRPYLNGSRGWG